LCPQKGLGRSTLTLQLRIRAPKLLKIINLPKKYFENQQGELYCLNGDVHSKKIKPSPNTVGLQCMYF